MTAQPTLMLDPRWASVWDYREQPRAKLPSQLASNVTRVPMWLFVAGNGARVISLRPVEVEVGREGPDEESPESAFVFRCKKLHVFASGGTYKEAEDSFHDQVVHFFYSYRDAHHDELSEDAAEIQGLYRQYFQESASGQG